MGIELEDIHSPSKVILQRQFFEAIVRACYVKYANDAELPTLAAKLVHMFKTKMNPLSCKNKSKSSEDEVRYVC